ncbi:hypothetical protein AVEN_126653-1 [Araneus ventricosus]|uniref:Uncharacterized protein n=1 Tax=Araneus ventricosus TaxID=182803 RepID=A0A4Y2UXB7_ARAVE|nr:hypothetical protein AVEN_126653-1 [Araneus ventricosus]
MKLTQDKEEEKRRFSLKLHLILKTLIYTCLNSPFLSRQLFPYPSLPLHPEQLRHLSPLHLSGVPPSRFTCCPSCLMTPSVLVNDVILGAELLLLSPLLDVLPCGLVVRIPGFHPGGPGSIPGMGIGFQ